MKRERLNDNLYFENEGKVGCFKSGSTLLDCALGGGWAENRICNVIGDKSTGKTLLAIEAAINYKRKFPGGDICYIEAEAAFDQHYAKQLGLPIEDIDFPPDIFTVEDLFGTLTKIIASKRQTFCILDSLDGLSDKDELERAIDKGSFGTGKAKQLSELFRRLVKNMANSNVTLMVVSQIRDNVGAMFGKKTGRSGGHALDFYCSQIIELAQLGRIDQQRSGNKRAIGIKVRARITKNKIALPFREAEFPIKFQFGIDDIESCLNFLEDQDGLKRIGLDTKQMAVYLKELSKLDGAEYAKEQKDLAKAVEIVWAEIEDGFKPTRRKY